MLLKSTKEKIYEVKDPSDFHYVLPPSLRSELGKPMGQLIKGSIEETLPVLKRKLVPHDYLLVAVGDVTSNLFVEHGFNPNIIVTDGQTKRVKLDEWKDWKDFVILEAECPAAEITPNAWKTLREAIALSVHGKCVHVKIHGEEDLLVLPLIIELPENSFIVYGQPNSGAVIREVENSSKSYAIGIINKMEHKQ